MTHSPSRSGVRRGFALPLVVLASLVIAMLVVVALERSTAQARTVKRDVDRYAAYHFTKGITGLIEGVIRSAAARQLGEVLDDSGMAFRLEANGSPGLAVYFYDGQDTLLESVEGLGAEDRAMAESALAYAVEHVSPEELGRHIRHAGPITVSANSAPRVVLAGAVDAALMGEGADKVVDAILRARDGARGMMTREDLAKAYDDAGVPPDKRSRLERMVTATPALWQFVVEPEVGARGGAQPMEGYVGVVVSAPPNADRGANVPKGTSVLSVRKSRIGPDHRPVDAGVGS